MREYNLTNEGRRRGLETFKRNEFSKRIGKRRFDEPGMEVRFKSNKTGNQIR